MPTQHAILSPSSSSRWMACSPSARLEALMPENETTYAREGTLAHSIGELRLRQIFQPDTDSEKYLTEYLNTIEDIKKEGFDLEEVYDKVLEVYCNYVIDYFNEKKSMGKNPKGLVEQRLSLEPYVKDGFGTSDAVVLSDDEIAVFDLKYGKGVKVNATDNTQMLCYALGVVLNNKSKATKVRMTIIQPRLNWISEWVVEKEELMDWAENNLKSKAIKADKAQGSQHSGKHCKFCNVLGICKEVMNEALSIPNLEEKLLSTEELSEALKKLPIIETWVNRIKDMATSQMLAGVVVPGYKVVEGRSMTKVTDPNGLIQHLTDSGFPREELIKPEEIKGITELKKLLKKDFEELTQGYISKNPGKPTIAEDDDPRDAISTQSQLEKDFTNILNN